MAVWFDGTNEIDCSLERVKQAVGNAGEYFVGVVGHMPGLTSVELVEQDGSSVTIRTNEGVMARTSVSTLVEADRVVLDFDEKYEAGTKVTVNSHFSDEFVSSDSGVTYRLIISDVGAPGLLGFFYRRFGRSKIGKSLLAAQKAFLEAAPD